MKALLTIVVLGILSPLIVYAVPTQSVWMTPETAVAGDKIEISAFVYNKTQKNVLVTVGFFDATKEIAQATSPIAPQTALAIPVQWVVPSEGTVITAKVTKAVDSSKKEVSELLGVVGSVTVGVIPQTTTAQLSERLKYFLGTVFAVVEPWRKEQAQRFAQLRDAKKVLLGISSPKEAFDVLNPIPPEAPAVPGTDMKGEPGLEDIAPRYQGVPIKDYAVYLYATAFATIFASVALFYILAVLLALFVVRFVVRLIAG
jgi:hypothetical protein